VPTPSLPRKTVQDPLVHADKPATLIPSSTNVEDEPVAPVGVDNVVPASKKRNSKKK